MSGDIIECVNCGRDTCRNLPGFLVDVCMGYVPIGVFIVDKEKAWTI